MASNIQLTKQLKDLTETEAVALLEEIKFKKITETLMSGEFGKVTGELLVELDDEILKSIGIEIPFQRKLFLKSMKTYKDDGVPLNLLRTAETDKTRLVTSIQASCQELEDCIQIPRKAAMREKLHALVNTSLEITDVSTEELKIYAYPAKKIDVKDLQKPLYVKDLQNVKNLKKIIIMGETGTGKSTLVDAFINYAVGVQMEDPFRFKLVVDEDDRANDQTVSKTSEISGYLIEDSILDFPIQIWDTPGFGDTRGIERDEAIKEQINELLKLEDFCHAVCFVVKASVNRLTDTQKYIIDRVLLFFGKEAQENIYILVTYADDERPDVLHALEKCNNFPFDEDRWFAFNNRNLFKTSHRKTSFSQSYWDIANNNMTKLFDMIGEITPFSLINTKEVITQRENLTQNLNAITLKLGAAAFRKDVWEKNLQDLQMSRDSFITNGEIRSSVPSTIIVKEKTSTKNTICKKCNNNCHIGCGKVGIVFCDKFDWKYSCKICHCDFSSHTKVRYKYKIVHEIYEEIHDPERFGVSESWAVYDEVKLRSEQGRNQEQGELVILIEKIKTQITTINTMAMLNYSLDTKSYFERIIVKEEEANNFKQAEVYRRIFQEECLMFNFMKHNEEAPVQTTKRLLGHEEKS